MNCRLSTVGVHRGLDDGALDLAGLGVGHVHVHREEATLGEEHESAPSGLSLGAMFSSPPPCSS
jgi:hypothetical protein